jgi:Tfp pilus assembly protein FimV
MMERSTASEWGRPHDYEGHVAWPAARKAKAKAVRRLTRKARKSRVAELQRKLDELRLVTAALAKAVGRFHMQLTPPTSTLDQMLAVLEGKPSASTDVVIPQSLVNALLED